MGIRFVTGTDTGVGKTVAAAALARAFAAEGRAVAYFKPVQTGVAPGAAGDADFVAKAAGIEASEGLRFSDPLAPAIAAAMVAVAVDVEALASEARKLARRYDELVVEGAGGLLVPLSEETDMAGFAALIEAELVVVTRPALGTLNHTALTLEAARSRGFDPALVVSSWPSAPGLAERTNLTRLATMAPVLGVVPEVHGLDVEGGQVPEPPRLDPAPG